MPDINKITAEVDLYGLPLKGAETEIDKSRLARKWYLKKKIRRWLAWQTGDVQDSIADVTKALVLGQAIALGIVTNTTVINKYKSWVQKLLDGYTAASIQEALQTMLDGVDALVFKKYNVAKVAIDAASTAKDINSVDVE